MKRIRSSRNSLMEESDKFENVCQNEVVRARRETIGSWPLYVAKQSLGMSLSISPQASCRESPETAGSRSASLPPPQITTPVAKCGWTIPVSDIPSAIPCTTTYNESPSGSAGRRSSLSIQSHPSPDLCKLPYARLVPVFTPEFVCVQCHDRMEKGRPVFMRLDCTFCSVYCRQVHEDNERDELRRVVVEIPSY